MRASTVGREESADFSHAATLQANNHWRYVCMRMLALCVRQAWTGEGPHTPLSVVEPLLKSDEAGLIRDRAAAAAVTV